MEPYLASADETERKWIVPISGPNGDIYIPIDGKFIHPSTEKSNRKMEFWLQIVLSLEFVSVSVFVIFVAMLPLSNALVPNH